MKTTLSGCGAGCETDINTKCVNEYSHSELGWTSQMRAVMSAFGVTADIDRSYGFPYDAAFFRLPIGKYVAVGALRCRLRCSRQSPG